ncbi:hypothetical protein DJ018_01360 [Phenylobacterium deserti]|uniref:Uncharacterized protein n=1 Tax=Phenylobacterium deserti TaxID=1914756 RepID=A0A328AQS9_9CAUL|nr:hypothetical protein DJ018_01360 [Phenylobacterium deserti]
MDRLSLVLVVGAGLALLLVLGGLVIRRFSRNAPQRAQENSDCGTGAVLMVATFGSDAGGASCDAGSGGGCD